jgi:hypothetical protein
VPLPGHAAFRRRFEEASSLFFLVEILSPVRHPATGEKALQRTPRFIESTPGGLVLRPSRRQRLIPLPPGGSGLFQLPGGGPEFFRPLAALSVQSAERVEPIPEHGEFLHELLVRRTSGKVSANRLKGALPFSEKTPFHPVPVAKSIESGFSLRQGLFSGTDGAFLVPDPQVQGLHGPKKRHRLGQGLSARVQRLFTASLCLGGETNHLLSSAGSVFSDAA